MRKYFSVYLLLISLSQTISADSFTFNSFNNHGGIGLINMPTARFYDESHMDSLFIMVTLIKKLR
jgi:hypothetical protein